MAIILNTKRSVMTLYSDPLCSLSHQVRFILALKGVSYETIDMNADNKPSEFFELSPEGILPTLLDRDLVITDIKIIAEYLDERFPHPPLMPVYPVARAKTRLIITRLEKEWVPLLKKIRSGSLSDARPFIKELGIQFKEIIPVFTSHSYFLGDEFSLVDCWLAPIIWRFEAWDMQFTVNESRILKSYKERLFSMDAFQASLTESELELKK